MNNVYVRDPLDGGMNVYAAVQSGKCRQIIDPKSHPPSEAGL